MGKSFVANNQGVHADQGLVNVLIPERNTAYLLTLLLWNPTEDAGAGNLVCTIQWTRPVGGSTNTTATLDLATSPSGQEINMVIWVLAGTPIQVSFLGGGTYGTATYSYLLSIFDVSSQECSDQSPFIPVPIGPAAGLLQPCAQPCPRCQRIPCCCQQGNQPIIILPQQQQPLLPPGPYPYPRRMPYVDYDDDFPREGPYNGPWQPCCD